MISKQIGLGNEQDQGVSIADTEKNDYVNYIDEFQVLESSKVKQLN